MDDHVNIAKAIRIGVSTSDVNAHLNYAIATEIDMWNSDRDYVIDVIADFTKPDIEDKWNQACQLENAIVNEFFNSFVCAYCGHRCPHNIMKIGLTYITDPNILELLLISSETEILSILPEFVYLQVQMIMLFKIRILGNQF